MSTTASTDPGQKIIDLLSDDQKKILNLHLAKLEGAGPKEMSLLDTAIQDEETFWQYKKNVKGPPPDDLPDAKINEAELWLDEQLKELEGWLADRQKELKYKEADAEKQQKVVDSSKLNLDNLFTALGKLPEDLDGPLAEKLIAHMDQIRVEGLTQINDGLSEWRERRKELRAILTSQDELAVQISQIQKKLDMLSQWKNDLVQRYWQVKEEAAAKQAKAATEKEEAKTDDKQPQVANNPTQGQLGQPA